MSNKKLKYISLFSGIEAASVAWGPLGWEPIAFSEIEPYPCELLKQRFPDVPNLGDITKIDWSSYRGKADIIVGGSPCQSFSIAGNREGLKGESGLMFEYIRAIREVLQRYFVWENVPGSLSSEKGAAFGQLLHEMDVCGYGLAWRVLDAQFFGVAQRRRRVFLVGCLGNAGRAAQILFDGESMRWDRPSSRDKRKSLAANAKSRLGRCYSRLVRCGCAEGKGDLAKDDASATLSTSNVQTIFQPCMGFSGGNTAKAGSVGAQCEVSPTLRDGSSGTNQVPDVVYALQGNMIGRSDKNGPQGDGINEDLSFTLNTTNRHAVAYLPFNPTQVTSKQNGNNPQWDDPCHTLSATDRPPHVICMADANAKAAIDEDLSGTLKVGGEPPIAAIEQPPCLVVRKLIPIECERLQGFPDGWTDIEFKGKPASDAARYKALGNSMAVPVMHWIGKQIARFDA